MRRIICERVWYGMVWYGMVWYGMVWYGMIWYGMVWYGMVWYGMVWYGMVWYGMVWYGMVWYTLFKSLKHTSPNNKQLVSMEGVFCLERRRRVLFKYQQQTVLRKAHVR